MARATILTDASFCHQTGAAGFGYWIASDRGKLGGGAELRQAPCNNVAEAMAIVNTLHIARKENLIFASDHVLVQTDSLTAIGILLGTVKMQGGEPVHEAYLAFAQWIGTSCIHLKHVKGHTNWKTHSEARFGANRMCDKRAGRYMRNMRKRLQGEIAFGGKESA